MFDIDHLPNQGKNEKAILVLRRHWFIFFLLVASFALLFLLPAIVIVFFFYEFPVLAANIVAEAIITILISAYYLFIFLFFFHNFLDYYLDVWIATNKRIISVEQKALFSRVVSEQKLNRIQDVTSEVHGFFATIFDYGDVFVQTAATKNNAILKQVPNPTRVRGKILELLYENRRFENIINAEDKITINNK